MGLSSTARRSTISLIGALSVLTLLALAAFAGQAHAVTPSPVPIVIDVAPSGADFTSISAAVRSTTDVLTKPVTIRVAAGNYRDVIMVGPSQITDATAQTFEPGAFDLTIEGGWNSGFTERDPGRATNIFGLPLASVVSIDDSTVTLDGLTLSHGFEANTFTGEGGGLWLCDSKVTVKNSKIIRTGGIYVGGVMSINSDLTFMNSEIAENEVGGLFGFNLTNAAPVEPANVSFAGLIAGGIAMDRGKLTLMDTTVRNNTSWGMAGGISLWETRATIKSSRILNNDARWDGFRPGMGGGIYAQLSDVQITNSILAGNYAGMNGGGIFFWKTTGGQLPVAPDSLEVIEPLNNRLMITNSTIANNTAAGFLIGQAQGGGVFVGGGGGQTQVDPPRLREPDTTQIPISTTTTIGIKNSIIWGNQAGENDDVVLREGGVDRANGFGSMNFRDSDVFIEPDTLGPIDLGAASISEVSISYSDIGIFDDALGLIRNGSTSALISPSPGALYGPGNISVDPKFVDSIDAHFIDARSANYHLMKYSPAIDSARALGAPGTDIDGAPRPKGLDFDMGAYEEQVNFDIVAPTPRIRSPRYSTQHSNQTKFRVIWSAVDPAPSANGLEYEVWVRRGGTGQYKKWLGWTSLRHSIYNGDRGHTYYFRVRVRDAAGNVSRLTRASMTMIPYDGLSAQLIRAKRGFGLFVGARHNTSYYMDTALTSRNRGDFIRYRVTGRRFSLISSKGPGMSRVQVYVDGLRVKTLDLQAPTNQYRRAVWNINFPTDGTHIIKFVNLATPGRSRMDIDGLARQLK